MKLSTKWIATIVTICMFIINGLSTMGMLGGQDTKTISDSLFTILTPIGWTFSIWGMIYSGLIYYLVSIWTHHEHGKKWYIISCLCNIGRLITWHYGYYGIGVLIIIGLLLSLYQRLNHHHSTIIQSIIYGYVGWVQVATSVMITIYSTHFLGLPPGIIYYIVGGLLITNTILVIYHYYKDNNITSGLVALRAYTGIFANQYQPLVQRYCIIGSSTIVLSYLIITFTKKYHYTQ